MALSSVAFALQNANVPADLLRQAISSLIPDSGGVLQNGDLAVTETGTPSMAVSIGPGRVWIPGSDIGAISGRDYTKQGIYFALNDASVTKTVEASDATNGRIDLVTAIVEDSFYVAGAPDKPDFKIIKGTAAASPTKPSLPNNAIEIASIDVDAGSTSVTDADIHIPKDLKRIMPLGNDTGWLTSGIVTAASGWSIHSQYFRAIGPIAFIQVRVVTDHAISYNNQTGNWTNTHVATITDDAWVPSQYQGLGSGAIGRLTSWSVGVPGDLSINASSGTTNITAGENFQCAGTYLLG